MPQDRIKMEGRPALEMLEEAFHVLRNAPVSAWLCYCAGSFPFVATFVYFWIEMSQSSFAAGRLGGLSLALVCLYAWMKCWQSVFASIIHRRLGGPAGPRWGWRRILRLAVSQTAIQPFSLLAMPISACLVLPVGWTMAFFHSVSVYGDGGETGLAHTFTRSAAAAKTWFAQNIAATLILGAFWLAILANVMAAGAALPFLLKSLFGLESQFTRSADSIMNTTFLAVCICMTYLCVNPLVKTYYVLRCFQIESISSGADIMAELEHAAAEADETKFAGPAGVSASGRKLAGMVILAGLLLAAAPGLADGPTMPEAMPQEPAAAKSQQLDQTIGDVINRSKYSWRSPRKEIPIEQQQEDDSFFKPIEDASKAVGDWFNDLGRWLERTFRSNKPTPRPNPGPRSSPQPSGSWNPTWDGGGSGASAGGILQLLCWLGVLAIVAVIGVVIWRFLRNRPEKKEDKPKQNNKAKPDLTKDEVSAEELPEDGWLNMAKDFIATGDYRLAVRAMYLACLSRLSQSGLIRVAKFKSNHDYRRELGRRSHHLPEMMPAFDRNLAIFESSWYGLHEVTRPDLKEFIANQERMRRSVAQG